VIPPRIPSVLKGTNGDLVAQRVDRRAMADDDASGFILEEARRQLDRQEASIDTVRNQVIAVLTAGTLAAGLFAGRTFGHNHGASVDASIAALVLYGLTAAVAIYVLWPRTMNFGFSVADYIADLKEGKVPTRADVTYNLSRDLEKARCDNAETVKWFFLAFAVMCALLGLQVIAWAVATV
jgi:hypothetical protein